VAASHFHTHMNEEIHGCRHAGLGSRVIPTFRALGINMLFMSDFHATAHPNDPGPIRLAEQKVYFDASRRHSDRDFLILPGEEPNGYLGAHYNMVFSKPVFWTMVRRAGQPSVEDIPPYGKVYHIGSLADEMEMLRQENGWVWLAHPRTKSSDGYPEPSRTASS